MGVCGAERSQVLVKFLVRTASRGERLFRSSRPDYIETYMFTWSLWPPVPYCSGLPGRTTLRQVSQFIFVISTPLLFRSSRPDYIETGDQPEQGQVLLRLFRSSRPDYIETTQRFPGRPFYAESLFRSSRPDYIETGLPGPDTPRRDQLFRSSRPDYIETWGQRTCHGVVRPLFRSSRPDYIETEAGAHAVHTQ